ncbi:lipase family alpha/beta hydrolase [Acinetobacter shaoyimingii]|uniref:Triacylglycerol lipase n=1 Tax=Acinetobacter shaoyimingii TaxID=2715164 RepID=A0A6G8RYS5_9GAMM|nr:triacylglycerol lipase [Acinetobacter shaoyimingii]NHB58065.1 triacylglycerol lipase [Acinetobacter shaoyimingii]QIO07015.1 triacylglycerol lipase [Acinetobacter shaoyimingii]
MKTGILKAGLCLGLIFSTLNTNAEVHEVTGKATSDYAQTKYPLFFIHGMFGFSKLGLEKFGVDYWYQILPDLKRNGAQVFASQLSPLHTTEFRGEQALIQLEEVLAISGSPKVNLIGHSQGGPTARYISGVAPEKVASVTGVSGTNLGSPVADLVEGKKPLNNILAPLVNGVVSPIISFAQLIKNLPSDFKGSINSLTLAGSLKFNERFPMGMPANQACTDGPHQQQGIYFYSWIGNANRTNFLDPDTIFTALGPYAFDKQENDGLVSVCSSKFGKTIRDDYKLNHFDAINQVLGLKSKSAPDPVALYRQHANRLKLQGL